MTKSHMLKEDDKPALFSFGLETEYTNIARWVNDNKRYSRRNLENETALLKQIAKDFIDVIETRVLTESQLDNFCYAIKNGASGVWEPAASKMKALSWYFDTAKSKVTEFIRTGNSQTVERFLSCVSESFFIAEIKDILSVCFNSKSKKVKIKASEIALDTRNQELIPFLEDELKVQMDPRVKDALQFAIDNMWQPKGELSFNS